MRFRLFPHIFIAGLVLLLCRYSITSCCSELNPATSDSTWWASGASVWTATDRTSKGDKYWNALIDCMRDQCSRVGMLLNIDHTTLVSGCSTQLEPSRLPSVQCNAYRYDFKSNKCTYTFSRYSLRCLHEKSIQHPFPRNSLIRPCVGHTQIQHKSAVLKGKPRWSNLFEVDPSSFVYCSIQACQLVDLVLCLRRQRAAIEKLSLIHI